MKFRFFFLVFLLSIQAKASDSWMPLPPGATAPDWTLTDLNGVSHNLYSYLDQGYTVVLDFSATWCGPCWNYHNTHILADLWDQYGPSGTNQVMVFFIEGDPSTPASALYGGPGSQGNWVAGTPYPIINAPNASVPNAYNITYFPTLYAVCPDRKIYEPGQVSLQTWVNWIQSCGLEATASVTDAPCSDAPGGAIDLLPTGGFGGLSFQWSNGQSTEDISNLAPGVYSCTVTEGQGHSIQLNNLVVGAPPLLTVQTTNVTPVTCPGQANGAISVSASGGTPGYVYSWSNGASGPSVSGLSGGVYQVSVTDLNGCQKVHSVSISEPATLSLGSQPVGANCGNSDGYVVLAASGGTFPYFFDIGGAQTPNPLFFGLPAGTYTGTVVDQNGCTTSASFSIPDLPGPAAEAGPDGTLNCAQSEWTLDGSNSATGNSISYAWTTDQGNIVSGAHTTTPLVDAPGAYFLEVSDALTGCVTHDTVSVSENVVVPTADAGPGGALDCSLTSLTLDGSGSSQGSTLAYLWETQDGNLLSGETTLHPQVDAAGTYTLTVSNTANFCAAQATVVIQADQDAPVADGGSDGVLDCLQQTLTLGGSGSSGGGNITYSWYTDTGNILSEADSAQVLVDAPGLYVLEVTNINNGCIGADSVTVAQDIVVPVADAGPAGALNCQVDFLVLDGSGSSNGSNFTYVWTTLDGHIASGETTLTPTVDAAGTYTLEVANTTNGCTAAASLTVTETPPVTGVLESLTHIACAGDATGSATVDGMGGNGPYQFEWPGGANGPTQTDLSAGSYSVTVTDADGCTDIFDLVIQAPAPLSANATSTGETSLGANDGTVSASPAGGVSPYSFWWSTGDTTATVSGLMPGSYTVSITDANGCTVEETATVNSFVCAISASIEAENVSCHGAVDGSATVYLSNGLEPYSFAWSSGGAEATETGLAPGTYTVSISDGNNCPTTANITINEPAPLVLDLSLLNHVACFGDATGSAAVEASGGSGGYAYMWPDGHAAAQHENLLAGSYQVTATDLNGCSATRLVTINQTPELTAVLEIDPESANNSHDGSILALPSGGNPGYTYVWNTGDTTATIAGLAPGTYTVTITDENGCERILSGEVEEYICPEVDVAFDITSVSCAGEEDGALQASPNAGTPPFNFLWSTDETTGSIGGLPAGLYDLTVTDAANCTFTANVEVPEPDALELWLSEVVSVECENQENGAATVEATGGAPDYAYTWSNAVEGPTAANLPPGLYGVTATDANGCSALLEVEITVGPDVTPPVVIVESLVLELDENGQALLTPEMIDGGSFDNCGIESMSLSVASFDCSDLGAQIVALTVTDGQGNMASQETTVTVVDAKAPSLQCPENIVVFNCDGLVEYPVPVATDNCLDPSVTLLEGLGASANFPVGVTTEVYQATDAAGNTSTCSFTVTIENTLEATAEATESCPDEAQGSASVQVAGGTPGYTYLWSNGATTATAEGLLPGLYEVTVADATGCTAVVEVSVEAVPSVSFLINQVIDAENGQPNGAISISVSDGTPPYAFAWYDEAGLLVGQMEDLEGVPAGVYTCEVTDANGCVWTSEPITVESITGLNEPDTGGEVSLFPNPTDGIFWLSISGQQTAEVRLALYDTQGKLLEAAQRTISGTTREIFDISYLPAGVYYLQIQTKGNLWTRKVVKQE